MGVSNNLQISPHAQLKYIFRNIVHIREIKTLLSIHVGRRDHPVSSESDYIIPSFIESGEVKIFYSPHPRRTIDDRVMFWPYQPSGNWGYLTLHSILSHLTLPILSCFGINPEFCFLIFSYFIYLYRMYLSVIFNHLILIYLNRIEVL